MHDNVRFDMLHNPNLSLTSTLERLYKLAKLMADCVVPLEYGISIENKRAVATKLCKELVEKIKYDLIIAKTDNQVDMRYMIDLSHSADLSINTLGRRIRTRLYFTSESHLHSLLNVLRFTQSDAPDCLDCPLTSDARRMLKETPELCYLTQIVIRLFEDTKKDMHDPKRFRIEIGFSPGATANPIHLSEEIRDGESTRYDTHKMNAISKDMLTCDDLEAYLEESITYGFTEESESEMAEKKEKEEKQKKKDKQKQEKREKDISPSTTPSSPEMPGGEENEQGKEREQETEKEERRAKVVAAHERKKWLVGGIAAVSLSLGLASLFLAKQFSTSNSRRWQR